MCLIAVKKRGAHLSDKEIRFDFAHNPNGAGFMYAKNGLVHWEKGFFNVEDLLARWHETVTDDMVAALHTRIATHGNHNCTELCHPFPLDGSDLFRATGSAPLVMMHNGIIPDKSWRNFAQNGDSDTSAFARKLTPILQNTLPDEGYIGLIKGYDPTSRFLLMNGDGEFVTIGNWKEDAGILFSNNHYMGLMSESDWVTYGQKRGFKTYGGNYYHYDSYQNNSYHPSGYSYTDLLKRTQKSENDFLTKEPVVEEISAEDIFDIAESYGLSFVEDDENGELRGVPDDDVFYFILDQGGVYDTVGTSPDDVRVYEFDAESNSFIESKGVWYHYYENPDQLNFDELLESC